MCNFKIRNCSGEKIHTAEFQLETIPGLLQDIISTAQNAATLLAVSITILQQQ